MKKVNQSGLKSVRGTRKRRGRWSNYYMSDDFIAMREQRSHEQAETEAYMRHVIHINRNDDN